MILIDKKYVKPKIGDKKVKRKFAFLPVRIRDKFVWLEKYEVVYIFAYVGHYETVVKSEVPNAPSAIETTRIQNWIKLGNAWITR